MSDSFPAKYIIDSINITGATDLVQLRDVTIAGNVTEINEMAAGEDAPRFVGGEYAQPDIIAQCLQVGSFLGLMGIGQLAADLNGDNTDVYYRKAPRRGRRTDVDTVEHVQCRIPEACAPMMWWNGIQAEQDSAAQLEARIIPVYEDEATAMIAVALAAIPTTAAVTELFTLGPAWINGTRITGLQSANWQTNVDPIIERDSGHPYPTMVGINRWTPTLVLRTASTNLTGTFPVGRPIAVTQYTGFLRQRKGGEYNWGDDASKHPKCVATSGQVRAQRVAGQDGMVDLMVNFAKLDADTEPWIWSLNNAIVAPA